MIFYADTAGERLDAFLARDAPDMSRSAAQRLIEEGRVTVNGKTAAKSSKLTGREVIGVELPDTKEQLEKYFGLKLIRFEFSEPIVNTFE